MALNGDIEDAKHEVALQLTAASFTTLLAAIDAEKAGSVTTPVAAAVFEGEKQTKSADGYPVAEIVGLRTLYDSNSEQSKDALHDIAVIWVQVGDDELTITRQLERLVRATRDTFWNALLPAIASAPVQVVSEEYSGLLPAQDHPFVKASQTILQIRTFAG